MRTKIAVRSENYSSEGGRRQAGGLGKCNFAPQTAIPIIIQLGGEWFKQMWALMLHGLSRDSYLLLRSSPAFSPCRWGCCCLLWKKTSTRLKELWGGPCHCILLWSSYFVTRWSAQLKPTFFFFFKGWECQYKNRWYKQSISLSSASGCQQMAVVAL